jgi:molybdate transport system substrate-binding protein
MTVRFAKPDPKCKSPGSPALKPSWRALVSGKPERVRALSAICFLVATALLVVPPASAERVLMFSAASTTDAVNEIIEDYRATSGADVAASFAASSALARQIENGAPAQLFLSAAPLWIDYLDDRGLLVEGSRQDRLGNRLALVAPADSPVEVTAGPDLQLLDLRGDGYLAMADPDHVPAGLYGRAALESFGLWQSVTAKVVRSSNVRAALALVERGEVPLGIVYQTDARASEHSRVVALFPETAHPPIRYPLALVSGQETPEARAFYDHLLGPTAAAIFERHGFTVH